jgi:cytoskeletal protein CcmA (bactofilin family)
MLFRRRTEDSNVPPAGVSPAEEGEVPRAPGSGRTVVGSQTRIRGTLKGEGSVIVRGEVEGEITIGGGLTITSTGRVDADVEAETVDLAGEARGTVRATSRVNLSPTGVFEGEVATPILEVQPGSVLQGRARVAGVPAPGRRGLSH